MRSLIWTIALISCGPAITPGQVNVSLSPVAKQSFVGLDGLPCSACTINTYLGGTTTPTPTYTSSLGTSVNTNPIVLDISGSANIWLNNTLKYKFVLKDALGSTVWSVDNVSSGSGGGSLPCQSAFAVNYTNSDMTALTCDPTITIDPSAHSIDIGGKITGPYFSLHNEGTIPASWTFDVTTPATALASLGTLPYAQFPLQNADTVVMNASGGSAIPTAVPLPSGCLFGINYSTSSHAYTCVAAGTVPLSSLAMQAADTVVMNASGASASPTAVAMPVGCTTGVTYSTVSHTWTCPTVTTTLAFPTRTFATTYTNGASRLEVAVTGLCTCNVGHFSQITAMVNGQQVVANGTTNGGGATGVTFVVPPAATYSVTFVEVGSSGGTLTLSSWAEWTN